MLHRLAVLLDFYRRNPRVVESLADRKKLMLNQSVSENFCVLYNPLQIGKENRFSGAAPLCPNGSFVNAVLMHKFGCSLEFYPHVNLYVV